MASTSVPTHGMFAAVYLLRPNGFNGAGLNDLTWGTGYNGAASASFEVVIDHAGTPDSFKWRKNGGAWTEDVAITGSAQTLSDGQTVTFGVNTGHTAGDKWLVGNLKDEPCTESTSTAQITDAAKRILNPNAPPAWTDSGGETIQQVEWGAGKGYFSGNVGAVTITGNKGYVPASALQKVGYLYDWSANFTVDIVAIARCGQKWKEKVAGQADGSGSAGSYFIAAEAFFNTMKNAVNQQFYFLELFTWDADQDQSGDRFRAWAALSGISISAPIGDVVKETVNFQVHGMPSFLANS